MKVMMDTYAWIEYFRGSEQGEKVREHVDNSSELFTPSIAIAELHDKYVRTGKEQAWKSRKHFVRLKSKISELDYRTAERAGSLKWELRQEHDEVGLADAVMLSHAIEQDARLLTGDKHLTHHQRTIDLED